MAVPKKGGYRFLRDYRAVNSDIEKLPMVMPNQEVDMARLRGARVLGKLDMLQCHQHSPLSVEAQEVFIIAAPTGLYFPLRIPQGILDGSGDFQAVFTQLLKGLNCEVWVDDVVLWGA